MFRPFRLVAGLVLLLGTPLQGQVPDDGTMPERRAVLWSDTDLPGGDLRSIFDTTLEACNSACLTDPACVAYTFNARSRACFPKSAPGAPVAWAGAFSARIVAAEPSALLRAQDRRQELDFLRPEDLAAAGVQARMLGTSYPSEGRSATDLMRAAAEAQRGNDPRSAAALAGAAASAEDAADAWTDHARRLLILAAQDRQAGRDIAATAVSAAVNAYLRAETPGAQHGALVVLAEALERVNRGRLSVAALRLAQSIQPRDDTALALERVIGLYGFRITSHEVQSDGANPRVCAVFTEDLAETGADFTPFVQLPEPGLAVERGGWRQLCVSGLRHGTRYSFTFREGLPAVDGQVLARPVPITAYVRDRSPAVRFPGRGYVLPRGGATAIPVETVNAPQLDLALFRVSDRNLVRSIQGRYFASPMSEWQGATFAEDIAEAIWTGTAEVGGEINRDVTTRLALDAALAGLSPGIHVLRASVRGRSGYETPAAWQWFVVSDLGITTLSGAEGLHVIVRSLGTAEAREGVSVTLLSRANAPLGEAVTDADGHAQFPAALMRQGGGGAPALVTVTDAAGDTAFLSLTEPEFDLSDRGVAGREAGPPIDVFIATDRGAYRAGETVHVTALARGGDMRAIPGLPLTVLLRRPDGVEHLRRLVADTGAGGHVVSLPVAATAPRGLWRIEVLADTAAPPLATRPVLVEDFVPERIDFTIAAPDGPLRAGGLAMLGLEARYLFGAAGADLVIEGESLLRATSGLAAYPGHVFGRADEPFSPVMEPLAQGLRTDDTGRATIPAAVAGTPDPGRPLEARFRLRLSEGSGRPVERELVLPVEPAGPMIGIRPLFDGTLPEGAEAEVQLIAVGTDLGPMTMDLAWTLTRIETRYQWYQLYGSWEWEPVTLRRIVAEGRAQTGADPVTIAPPVEWGEYELAVTRADAAGPSSSLRFSAGWYPAADVARTPDTLELALDRPAYRPGETARLRIVPRAAGTALVSVLADRVIAMRAVAVEEGENLIELPVTDDWGAGVYVTASVLRPMDITAGRLPARSLGLSHAAIDPGPRRLGAVLELDAEAEPRKPLDIALRLEGIAPGETAHATIAAVDLGILNLTGFSAPDPAGHYFGQRRLGVGIRDLYGRLIDGMNGAEGLVRSGGDAGAAARLQAPPPTEDLLAFFTGPLVADADGVVRSRIDLPAFNGTVRVMAVAWSPTAVGQATADVLVRDPVVVTASLPRFLAPGDESRLLLEFAHTGGPGGEMALEVTAEGLALGPVPPSVELAEGARAALSLPLVAGPAGSAHMSVALTTPDGRRLEHRFHLPVEVTGPEVTGTSRFTLGPGQALTVGPDLLAGLIPGSGVVTVALGESARLDLPGLLAMLDRYPYGCTEQVTSVAMPLLYHAQIAGALGLTAAAAPSERIAEAVARVLLNQTAEGGFGLWGPYGGGEWWLDAYVTDFLARARHAGHAVPDRALRAALDNLRNRANYAGDFDSGGEALAYALVVLAREGAAAIGDLRYYADVKAEAFGTPLALAQLGAALAMYGEQGRADALFERAARLAAAAGAAEPQRWREDFGSSLRDTAGLLALAAETGSTSVDLAALTGLVAGRLSDALSPQEAAWTLLAGHALMGDTLQSGITRNGEPLVGPPVDLLAGGAMAPTSYVNDGARDLLVTLTTRGVPLVAPPPGGTGYTITRRYFTLDGMPLDRAPVAAGTRLVTVLDVTPHGRGEARLMVADPLPAGFEIDNPNLLRGGQVSALDWLALTEDVTHAEFRSDRFLAALDRHGPDPVRLAYIVRAVSPGSFHHPAPSVEDMYRPAFRAIGETGRIVVTE